MKRLLKRAIEQVLRLHKIIKEIDQIPFRALHGEFYEEEDAKPPKVPPRKNKVKVEDLRPHGTGRDEKLGS